MSFVSGSTRTQVPRERAKTKRREEGGQRARKGMKGGAREYP